MKGQTADTASMARGMVRYDRRIRQAVHNAPLQQVLQADREALATERSIALRATWHATHQR